MQAKEFLLKVQIAEKELKVIGAKKRHYLDLAQSIGAKMSITVVQTSGNASKTETAAIGLYEMTKMLEEKEKEYCALIKQAEELIAKIRQEKFRDVLTYKYLCNWSWQSISDELGYKDKRSSKRCHGFALVELQKVM